MDGSFVCYWCGCADVECTASTAVAGADVECTATTAVAGADQCCDAKRKGADNEGSGATSAGTAGGSKKHRSSRAAVAAAAVPTGRGHSFSDCDKSQLISLLKARSEADYNEQRRRARSSEAAAAAEKEGMRLAELAAEVERVKALLQPAEQLLEARQLMLDSGEPDLLGMIAASILDGTVPFNSIQFHTWKVAACNLRQKTTDRWRYTPELFAYYLQRGHVGSPNYNVGFPRELLEAILGNIAAVEWLHKHFRGSELVWSAFSQNDLESGMNVSVGPGGHKYDMRGTEHQLMSDARFTVDGMDPHNIAAQPVATNAAY
eukprot:SAG31_NODE_1267_length_9068_cov_26.326346_8_plen_318_part_01